MSNGGRGQATQHRASGEWRWSPHVGRWSPAIGYPMQAVHLALSTRDFGVRDPYDAWRHHAYYNFDAAPLPPAAARSFRAEASGILTSDGEFYRYSSDAVTGRSLACEPDDSGDNLYLGLVVDGRRHAQQHGDAPHLAARGSFFLYDSRRATDVQWSRHRAMHLVLRRPAIERAMGGALPPASRTLAALDQSRLAPVLRAQFRLLAGHMGRLDPVERAVMIDQTLRLALFACGAAVQAEAGGLYVAALRLIERQLADPMLSPAGLAQALGVSRATLYRAFAAREQAVAETIRDMRLDRARAMLATVAGIGVSDAALACGWLDTANFARAFRMRFGLLPSEVRAPPR